MKVALVYDRVNKFGGAERVLLALHEIFPKAPLYTSVYDEKKAPWAKAFEVRTSFLQQIPMPKDSHELYPFLMGLAFEQFNFDEFDVVISITSEFAKAIITKPKTLHICYCLNPVGYIWSGYEHYFANKSNLFKLISLPMIKYLRWYDRIVCRRPDVYVSISQTVQARVLKYYGIKSSIIYPPVEIDCKKDVSSQENQENFFLIVSRLVPNKRLDIAINAFNELNLPLKIIGSGKEEDKLRNLAQKNIEFLGGLTDEQVNGYYQKCRAFVLPGIEDFGITALEAQSFGKPVIAYRGGGALETVIEGKTGWFFDKMEYKSLINAINLISFEKIYAKDCLQNAKRFSKNIFLEKFKTEVVEMVKNYQ